MKLLHKLIPLVRMERGDRSPRSSPKFGKTAPRRRRHGSIFSLALPLIAAVACNAALAQAVADYPSKPVTMIVGFPPGTATDSVARVLAERFTARLGKTFLVDNKPGQGGSIGAAAAAKAAPDGYTLVVSAQAPLAINPNLYERLPYDSIRDFAPIGITSWVPYVLVVNPNLRINSVQELLVFAKANPEKLSYASTGNGTTSHLLMAMLSQRTGAKFTHVPYKGSAQSQTDLIAGQVDLTFDTMVSAMPHVKSGKLKALAVSGLSRSAYAADIPTVHEQGVAGFEGGAWLGLLAPAGTPRPIIEKLNRELNAILADSETEKRLLDLGLEMRRGTPEEFGAYIQSERDKWGRLVRESGAKIE